MNFTRQHRPLSALLILSSSWLPLAAEPIQAANSQAPPTTLEPDENASEAPYDESGLRDELENAELEAWQTELLEIAFESACAFPLQPHIKNRSRAQEQVIQTCLALDQPRRALDYLPEIKNWRRGAAWSDLATWCVEHELELDVQPFLDLAEEVALNFPDAQDQGWRRDRIRAKIGRVHLLLGQHEQALPYTQDLEGSEVGTVTATQAELADAEQYEDQVKAVEAVFELGDFDPSRAALSTCSALYARYYEHEERRERVGELMKKGSQQLPMEIRIRWMTELADVASAHEDFETASEWLEEAHTVFESVDWSPRYGFPLRALLAASQWRAGNRQDARSQANQLLTDFAAHREAILEFERAETLRPLAEAYQVMRESDLALTVYRTTVEEGALNVNARPRCDDLVATLCSMAANGVEPDEQLFERLREISKGLGDPW